MFKVGMAVIITDREHAYWDYAGMIADVYDNGVGIILMDTRQYIYARFDQIAVWS